MSNERLREALLTARLTSIELAQRIKVDPKTVQRWITQGRPPYERTRHEIAEILGKDVHYLWPNATSARKREAASQSEIVHVYPNRSAVPSDLWDSLLLRADAYVDILVYVGMFMTERPNLLKVLKDKAQAGTRIRLAFGDKSSAAVKQRGRDEDIGADTIPAKIDHALSFMRPLASCEGIQIRKHKTTLYNSIYRFDDEMIVNPHVYGKVASHAPALHLRRLAAGDLFTTYADSFATVWETAKPAW